jgi:hypothetical protein
VQRPSHVKSLYAAVRRSASSLRAAAFAPSQSAEPESSARRSSGRVSSSSRPSSLRRPRDRHRHTECDRTGFRAILPSGLFYSFNESYDKRPGRLVFIARPELERAFAAHR